MNKLMRFTGTALKNLFSAPVTTSYPDKPYDYPEITRGHIEIDFEKCTLCSLCSKACPPRAIDVDKRSGNWILNAFDCIQCGACVNACAKKCLSIVPGYTAPDVEKRQVIYHKEVEKTYPNLNQDLCVYCTLCAKNCPVGALAVDRKEKTWELNRTLCISCGLCAHNCPKKCLDMKKESKDKYPVMNAESCVYCTLCAKKCPVQALTVDRKEKTWVVDKDTCVACGLCASSCPKGSIELK